MALGQPSALAFRLRLNEEVVSSQFLSWGAVAWSSITRGVGFVKKSGGQSDGRGSSVDDVVASS